MNSLIREVMKVPIYQDYKFELKEGFITTNIELFLTIFNISSQKDRIHCPYCDHIETFMYYSSMRSENVSYGHGKVYRINSNDYFEYDDTKIHVNRISKGNPRVVNVQGYYCSMDISHKIDMYFALSKSDKEIVIRKIGQTPSPYELGLNTTLEYKRILDKFESFGDYQKSFIHNVYGDRIAELLYLRRVFEKIINKLIDDKDIVKELTIKKIKYLRENSKLDPETEELSGIVHGLLSKGIHELDDSQCGELSASLRYFIELQLIHLQQQDEKSAKLKKLKSTLNSLHEDHNKK